MIYPFHDIIEAFALFSNGHFLIVNNFGNSHLDPTF